MRLIPLLALLLAPLARAQELPAAPASATPTAAVPRFSRTPVGSCGCALYAPVGMVFDPPTRSLDGADVWTGEVASDAWTFGAIVVRFAEPMATASPDDLEGLLISYLDFLKGQLDIVEAAGVGRGHTHAENAAARGVIDYWKDKDGMRWAVKGWVDAGRLAVLYVKGKQDYPYLSAQQLYLDGFRFSE